MRKESRIALGTYAEPPRQDAERIQGRLRLDVDRSLLQDASLYGKKHFHPLHWVSVSAEISGVNCFMPLLCIRTELPCRGGDRLERLGPRSRRIYPRLRIVARQARPGRGLKLRCSFRDPSPGHNSATRGSLLSPRSAERSPMLECAGVISVCSTNASPRAACTPQVGRLSVADVSPENDGRSKLEYAGGFDGPSHERTGPMFILG